MNHTLCSLLTILFFVGPAVAPELATAQPPGPARAGVEPTAGPAGTRFAFFATGFLVDEPIAVWRNTPNGQTAELYPDDLRNANAEGVATWSWVPGPATQPGPWEMVARGIDSGVQYVIPFELTPTTEIDQLPAITAFDTARFDLMLQAQTGPVQEVAYGNGALVLPDQVYARITTAGTNETVEIIRIGPDLYINRGEWTRVAQDLPPILRASLPLDAQLARLPEYANGIVYLGQDSVRGVITHHYQLWLTGSQFNALNAAVEPDTTMLPDAAVIKIDLWIGVNDQLLHQQGSVITIPPQTTGPGPTITPAVEFQALLTYYDFNNPGIVITAPRVP